MSDRIYVPTTLAGLRELAEAGLLPASADAVLAPDDDEETEYDALLTAADASALLLSGPGRRVVVVAEVADADGPVRLDQVVAVHVDLIEDARPDDDLGWFAPAEIPVILDEA
ncbi:MAG: DUF6912 family protein [Nocardioides sp.]